MIHINFVIETKNPEFLYFEAVSNPMLIVADVAKIFKLAKKYDTKIIIDNTINLSCDDDIKWWVVVLPTILRRQNELIRHWPTYYSPIKQSYDTSICTSLHPHICYILNTSCMKKYMKYICISKYKCFS